MDNNEKRLTLMEHLVELRIRLIRAFLALTIGTGGCLYFAKEIFQLLQKPLTNALPVGSRFIVTSPLEAMITYLQVALLAGLFLSSPFVFYQLWRFVVPGLRPQEKRWGLWFVAVSTLFFVGGALFGYFVIFPIGFKFFVSILAGTNIQLLPQMKDYLGFIAKMLLTFGFVFETPVILVLLSRLGIVNHQRLAGGWRYIIVAAFLVAGILTPGPDILSQLLLGIPLLGLYGISLLAVWVMEKRYPLSFASTPPHSPYTPQTPGAADPRSPPTSPGP